MTEYHIDSSGLEYGRLIIMTSLSLGTVAPFHTRLWGKKMSPKVDQHLQKLICVMGVLLERPQMESPTPVKPVEAVAPWTAAIR